MSIFEHIYWRLYYFMYGIPSIKNVDEELALNSIGETNITASNFDPPCDCAVYDNLKRPIKCYPKIKTSACNRLSGNGKKAFVFPVGSCATLPDFPE